MGRVHRSLIVALVLLQVVTSATFPSLVRNEIICNMVHAQTTYIIHLESREDTGASMNKGSITLDGTVITLPRDIVKAPGVYTNSYSPASDCIFVGWETSGGVSVMSPTFNAPVGPSLTVTGEGTLRAVYATAYSIRFLTAEDNGASYDRGQVHIDAGSDSHYYASHGQSLVMTAGLHTISCTSLWGGYAFVRWMTTGAISVSNSASISTDLRVNGPGNLTLIYRYLPRYAVRLEFYLNGVSSQGSIISFGDDPLHPDSHSHIPPAEVSLWHGTHVVTWHGAGWSGGIEYVFVRWETFGSISVSDSTSYRTILSVPGPGTLRAVVSGIPQSRYTIQLRSQQADGASTNKGRIVLDGVVCGLPEDLFLPSGVYQIEYRPVEGYAFVKWETIGGVSISSSTSISTTLNVTGQGTLKSTYTSAPIVRLESEEDNRASTKKGSLSITGSTGQSVYVIGYNYTLALGSYEIYFGPSGYPVVYRFLRYYTTGGLSVSDPSSDPTTLTVTGSGTLKIIYTASSGSAIHLESEEDNGVSTNKGAITLDGTVITLPRDVAKAAGVYSISYSPASGYAFVRWQTTDGVSVSGSTSISTTLTVAGQGTLKAQYRAVGFAIHLDSAQDTGASVNGGSITLDGTVITLPRDVAKAAGVYSISYSPASGYAFVRWQTTDGVSVSGSTSISTTLTVTGAGTLKAVYAAGVNIHLESAQDTGASANKGSITLDGAVLTLPTDVVKPAGVYSISYSPAGDYVFLRWDATGGVSVPIRPIRPGESLSLTITGSGTLKAIYKLSGFVIHLESAAGEGYGASVNLGTITLDGGALSLPTDVVKPAGVYPVSYSSAMSYYHVRWETTGSVYVSNPNSQSTSLTVKGQGTLKAIYHPSFGCFIDLESREDGVIGASPSRGSITLDGVVYALPRSVWRPVAAGVYSISYSSASGYVFVRWETSGGLSVASLTSISTLLTVTGSGTLRARFSVSGFQIYLTSVQHDETSESKGYITLAGVRYSTHHYVTKPAGVYSVSYSPASGYAFVRWETVGGVSVLDFTSVSTSLTVTGPGTLKAIYALESFYIVHLESAEIGGASTNEGTITLDATVFTLPKNEAKCHGLAYFISYSPASGYAFVRWETTGILSVSSPTSMSTTCGIAGAGTLKAIYALSSRFVIHLESVEDNGASTNKGNILLGGASFGLPTDVMKAATVYRVAYSSSQLPYDFVKWETTGGVSVLDFTSVSTSLTVTGSGVLKARYRASSGLAIHLESAQDNWASSNKGTIVLANVASTLPADVIKLAGVYSISYSPASGYTFVRWETTARVSVSNPASASTSCTVTGAGALMAIYFVTPQTSFKIDLKSGEDGGATSNKGQIRFAGTAYSQLPAQVSKTVGSYSISYDPAAGYGFLKWQVSGAITVTQPNSRSTTAKVTGQGTLTAIYKKGGAARQPLPFGVALSPEPDAQSVRAGQLASFKVNVRLVYGSAPVVSLNVAGLPDNATYSFSVSSGTPPYSSDLTISIDPSTPPGTYICSVTCSALDELDSTFVTLIVDRFKPPSLLSITTKPNIVEEGEPVTVTGSLMPYLPATIQLIYRSPAGTEITREVRTDTGNFTDTFKPDAAGDWSVKTKWAGDSDLEGSESQLAQFSVKASPLKTILPITVIAVVAIAAAFLFYLRKKRSH